MIDLLRLLFFLTIVKPLVQIIIGLNIRRRELLPNNGPAIIVANHNSHLDTLVLMSLFPLRTLKKVRPAAAADYFLKNRFLAWFSENIMHIIPVNRTGLSTGENPLAGCSAALDKNEIVILFPEGSRGEPEKMIPLKRGIAHLAKVHQDVPIIPIFLHGLGKALPKGEPILVPFFCDVFIGESIRWNGQKDIFMDQLSNKLQLLSEECHPQSWD